MPYAGSVLCAARARPGGKSTRALVADVQEALDGGLGGLGGVNGLNSALCRRSTRHRPGRAVVSPKNPGTGLAVGAGLVCGHDAALSRAGGSAAITSSIGSPSAAAMRPTARGEGR